MATVSTHVCIYVEDSNDRSAIWFLMRKGIKVHVCLTLSLISEINIFLVQNEEKKNEIMNYASEDINEIFKCLFYTYLNKQIRLYFIRYKMLDSYNVNMNYYKRYFRTEQELPFYLQQLDVDFVEQMARYIQLLKNVESLNPACYLHICAFQKFMYQSSTMQSLGHHHVYILT